MGLQPVSVLGCVGWGVHTFKCKCETIWSIAINFFLKHHWNGGKVALGFEPDQIRTGFHGNI